MGTSPKIYKIADVGTSPFPLVRRQADCKKVGQSYCWFALDITHLVILTLHSGLRRGAKWTFCIFWAILVSFPSKCDYFGKLGYSGHDWPGKNGFSSGLQPGIGGGAWKSTYFQAI